MLPRWIFLAVALCAASQSRADDSVVVFNELMYNEARGDELEWIELYNQMAVDVELSGWRITGAAFTFPAGTIIPARGYLVVASDPPELAARSGLTNVLGPLTSRLANDGERVRLLNHNGRIMDQLRYRIDDPWPPGADGTGFSLSKAGLNLASEDDRNWRASRNRGGTPGRENFSAGEPPPVVRFTEITAPSEQFFIELHNRGSVAVALGGWRIEGIGEEGIYELPSEALAPGEYRVVPGGELGFSPREGNRLLLLAEDGARLIDAVVVKSHARARSNAHQDRWLVPSAATPGAPNVFEIEPSVVINEIMYHPRPLAPSPAIYDEEELIPMTATWDYWQGGTAPAAGWTLPEFEPSGWFHGEALLYVEDAPLPAPKNTALQLGSSAYYFRAAFDFAGAAEGAELYLEHIIDDGAVFYLNGVEIYRYNMPEGAISHSTMAATGIPDATLIGPVAIPAGALVTGRNVLAVEVHQASAGSSDIVFGCRVGVRELISPARDFQESDNQWIELYNRGTATVELAGWHIGDNTRYHFPPGTTIGPGEYLVLAKNLAAFEEEHPGVAALGNFEFNLSNNSDLITLLDAVGNPVDEVRYYDDHPWPALADGTGPSLELRDPRSDNSRPESWQASERPGEWETYSYTAVAQADNGPTRWNEFVFGLLQAGEVLLDDFSVIESPGPGQRELLRNGGFENGAAYWRFLGTHRQATVIDDPDQPGNAVLHLIADGPTEHMHNQVQTTLTGNTAIVNGRTYRISFRAKWLAGCNKLNTRLYFNRVARTTDLRLPERFGTPGASNSTRAANAGPTFSDLRHSPIVPSPAQAVTVTVRVDDPDGVEAVRLWSRTAQTGWASVAMTSAPDGVYSAALSPRPAGTVVQFYVEAEDGQGAVAHYPAAGPDSRALYTVADSQGVSARIHNIRLIMLPPDAEAMHAPTNVMSNGRSGLTVVYNDREVFYDTSLHLQASQRGRMNSARVGFTVRFPADQLFRGTQGSITFDRSGGYSGRGGRHDEIVMRHILNQGGRLPDMYNDIVRVLAPLSTHTGTAMLIMAKHKKIYWDGIRDDMGNGGLFKLELIYYPTTTVNGNPEAPKMPQPDEVTGIDFGNRGEDKEAYRWFFLNENREEIDDYRRMIELSQAFSLTGQPFEERIEELLDVTQWARVFAAKSLSGDVDTYGFGLAHNIMFFFDPAGKALVLPWDMDFSWTRGTSDGIYPGSEVGRIFSIPRYRRLFMGHLDDLLKRVYNPEYMERWTAHYGMVAGQNYSGVLTYIEQRAAAARGQLPAPAPFRILSHAGQGFTTNVSSVRLRGQAPYTFERLEAAGRPGTEFTWIDVNTWEADINLTPGLNQIRFTGYGYNGEQTGEVAIQINSLVPSLDRDGDGMPDDWEIAHGLDPDRPDADEDADGDGMSNLEEYRAGTDPRDAGSRLGLQVSMQGAGIQLSFRAVAGRAYRLQYKSGLQNPWVNLLSVPAGGTDQTIQVPQTVSPLANALFYRLVLDQ